MGKQSLQAGIAAVDVHSGKIVAVGGSRTNEARTLNRAITGKQQIGSTAKPIFDYGPGMEYEGWSTYTIFDDSPYSYSSGQPIRDSDRKYMGKITLRTALAQSRNIPALKAFQKVSNDKKYKFVTSLGITPETTDGSTYMHEAHSIGAFNGSNPLEMAAAYAAFSGNIEMLSILDEKGCSFEGVVKMAAHCFQNQIYHVESQHQKMIYIIMLHHLKNQKQLMSLMNLRNLN